MRDVLASVTHEVETSWWSKNKLKSLKLEVKWSEGLRVEWRVRGLNLDPREKAWTRDVFLQQLLSAVKLIGWALISNILRRLKAKTTGH